MDTDGCILFLSIALVILVIRAIYAAFENAVTEVSDQKLKSLAATDRKYERLNRLSTNPSKMLLTFSVHRTLSAVLCIICISISAVLYLPKVSQKLFETPLLLAVCAVAASIVIGMILIIITDLIPKTLTEKSSLGFAVFSFYPVTFLIALYSPVTCCISAVDSGLRNLAGLSSKKSNDIVTEEKILMMLEAGNETGVIESSEKEMINNIFEFDDVCVNEVMTHRTELVAADADTPACELVKIAIEEGFSRIPVYEDSIDSLIGVVYVKDLLCLIVDSSEKDMPVRRFMREALYVPETNTCAEVFDSLTQSKNHIAIVLDEYGGTAGIVTMEDLIEEIVGNIQDEYDDEESEFTRIDENTYSLSGSASPADILPMLEITAPDECEYATMSAFYINILGRIPDESDADKIEFMGYEFIPTLIEDNWVSRLRATKITKETQAQSDSDSDS